jgi:hypothetical protein
MSKRVRSLFDDGQISREEYEKSDALEMVSFHLLVKSIRFFEIMS